MLRAVSHDEAWHIDWIRRKACALAAQREGVRRVDEALRRYREIDRAVMQELAEVEHSLLHGGVASF